MATHSSVLAWRIPGTVEPGGLLSVGSHRVGHDWSNSAAADLQCHVSSRCTAKWISYTCTYIHSFTFPNHQGRSHSPPSPPPSPLPPRPNIDTTTQPPTGPLPEPQGLFHFSRPLMDGALPSFGTLCDWLLMQFAGQDPVPNCTVQNTLKDFLCFFDPDPLPIFICSTVNPSSLTHTHNAMYLPGHTA